MTAKARYIMVGGFLGAGKSTTLLRLAERLRDHGLKVGLITNDQSVGLVDTTILDAHQFPVEEITGGCFCCRFQSLTDAAEKLSQTERPDVFLAEPVGSCTDLTATVSYPLRRLYGDNFSIAPFSVLVDPIRAERILGLETGKSFSPKVIYIYEKQLEEADIIVVNKKELLSEERLERLLEALRERYPDSTVVAISARTGDSFAEWAELIEVREQATGEAIEIDYDIYAEGEALLGWMNLTATISAEHDWDGNVFLAELMQNVQEHLQASASEVAHLKMTLTPAEGTDLAVMNLVRTESQIEASHQLEDTLASGELIINLRAETAPEELKTMAVSAFQAVAAKWNLQGEIQHVEAFRPGRPVPTHRDLVG